MPYIAHPFGVALILDRYGFPEDVVIAGLLHDVVEDADISLETVRQQFGDAVTEIVAAVSERKTDDSGMKRPWADRKRDFLATVATAPVEARAVAVADKLHNLASIRFDLEAGRPVWSLFNADRSSVLDNYRISIERFTDGEERLSPLAAECRTLLDFIAADSGEQSGVDR